MSDSEQELKCFEYICPLYPKCSTAAGSCCAIDDFYEDSTLPKEKCFSLPEKPYFREKKTWRSYYR